MKRKGISPLIAAVLLIAFTMAVASIFAQWAPQLLQDAQGDTSDRAQEIQECSDITMEVSGNTENATIQQKTGNNPAGNLTVTWFYTDGTSPEQNTTASIDSSRGVVKATGGSTSADADALDRIEVDLTDCEGASSAEYDPEN